MKRLYLGQASETPAGKATQHSIIVAVEAIDATAAAFQVLRRLCEFGGWEVEPPTTVEVWPEGERATAARTFIFGDGLHIIREVTAAAQEPAERATSASGKGGVE